MTLLPESLINPPELTNSAQGLLGEVLSHLHIGSALFLRAEYTEPWAYESPSCEVLCSVLQPGAQRLILFHIVAKGRCWIEIDGGESMWAEEGDIIMPSSRAMAHKEGRIIKSIGWVPCVSSRCPT